MEINKLSYTDFISLIREENRPPGGKKTVREFVKNSFINKNSKVLEVGCTNGFTSLEIARLINCKVWGIDLNKSSIDNAKSRVKSEKVTFMVADAINLPFKSNFFDMVVCSNATSFIKKKDEAIKEYFRVTKPWGFVAACPMYYVKVPPKKILNKVSKIIQNKIDVKTKNDWLTLFKKSGFEIYFVKDYLFDYQSKKSINNLVKETVSKPHMLLLPKSVRNIMASRWKNILSIFNSNLSYVGYSIIILRKREEVEETELFTSIPAKMS